MPIKKYLPPTLALLVIVALVFGGWQLWSVSTAPAPSNDSTLRPTLAATEPAIAMPIRPTKTLAKSTNAARTVPPTLRPTTTPMLMPQTTPRPTTASRTAFIRCDNPSIWSLPVVDAQLQVNTTFGNQPVGSVYYEGLVALKLITPAIVIAPVPTVLATLTTAETDDSFDYTYGYDTTVKPGIFHPGLDLHTGENAPIFAVASGTVNKVSYSDVYGLYVILQVPGYQVLYGHLNETTVEEGQPVNCGQLIGQSGATGVYQTGPHLHFEVRQNGTPIDPLPILQRTAHARLPNDLKVQMQAYEAIGKTQ